MSVGASKTMGIVIGFPSKGSATEVFTSRLNSSSSMTTFGGGSGEGGPPHSSTASADITELKTHMGYVTKGLGLLAVLSLAALGWIFYNIYEPMQDLRKDAAVQTSVLGDIKDDLKQIREDFARIPEPIVNKRPVR